MLITTDFVRHVIVLENWIQFTFGGIGSRSCLRVSAETTLDARIFFHEVSFVPGFFIFVRTCSFYQGAWNEVVFLHLSLGSGA